MKNFLIILKYNLNNTIIKIQFKYLNKAKKLYLKIKDLY
jgi:hypothetical protein